MGLSWKEKPGKRSPETFQSTVGEGKEQDKKLNIQIQTQERTKTDTFEKCHLSATYIFKHFIRKI